MSVRTSLAIDFALGLMFAGAMLSSPPEIFAQTGARSPLSPADQVAKLLSGLEHDDFRKVFDAAFVYQKHLEGIRAENPQVMWPRLTDEYYETKKTDFLKTPATGTGVVGSLLDSIAAFAAGASGSPEDPASSSVRALMKPRPIWKILETRKLQPERDQWSGAVLAFSVVYIQLNYRDSSLAPVLGEGLLKEAILGIRIEDGSGLFWSTRLVPKSESHWQLSKPRLLSAQWVTVLRGSFNIGYNVLGGKPPYSSVTQCGPYSIEKIREESRGSDLQGSVFGSPLETPHSHINISVPRELPNASFPLSCAVTISDSSGATDSASFLARGMYAPGSWAGFCWVRNPWLGWGQALPRPRGGCTGLAELTDAAASDPKQPSESSVASLPTRTAPAAITPTPGPQPERASPRGCDDAPTCIGEAAVAVKEGRYADASNRWTKALDIGGVLSFRMCREGSHTFQRCLLGTFYLNKDELKFIDEGGTPVFTIPLRTITLAIAQTSKSELVGDVVTRLKVRAGDKEQSLNYLPGGGGDGECVRGRFYWCKKDKPNARQQEAVTVFLADAISRASSEHARR